MTKRPVAKKPTGQSSSGSKRTSVEPPASIRWLLLLAAVLSLVGAIMMLLTLAPELQAMSQLLAVLASFAPYGWLAWLGAVVAASFGARGRTRIVIAALMICLTWHTALISHYLPRPVRTEAKPDLKVLEQNLRFGRANLGELTDQVAQHEPDLVVLTEITKSNAEELTKQWRKLLPYRAGTPGRDHDPQSGESDGTATMVFSRFPLEEQDQGPSYSISNVVVRLQVAGQAITLIAAHPTNPVQSLHQWLVDYAVLTELCGQHVRGPLLVAGDLNATAEHLPLRELQARIGLTDAAVGKGWQPTFPTQGMPSLIQIDHILATEQFQATEQQTLRISDTDHLGLLATFVLAG